MNTKCKDSVDNNAQENSSVFSLIRMRWLPSARAVKLCTNKIFQFQLTQAELYNGRKMGGWGNAECQTTLQQM